MAFRFFRRIRIAPGISFNLSKRGASLSLGPRGAKYTVGTHGTRKTVGIPGTGLFYTEHDSWNKRGRSSTGKARARAGHSPPPTPQPDPADRLSMGFFKRLVTPKEEEHLVDGLAHLVAGRESRALEYFNQALHLADAAFLAGAIHLKKGHPREAATALRYAAARENNLGEYLARYGAQITMRMRITPEVSFTLGADRRGLTLALVEALQELNELHEAVRRLSQLRKAFPHDPVVLLSLVELLMESAGDDRAVQKKVVDMTNDIDNDSEVHAVILLFRAKALAGLGLDSAARSLLSNTLRRKKDRSEDLLKALRYERALAYERLGHSARARKDLELIYAEDAAYEDVATRLGVA